LLREDWGKETDDKKEGAYGEKERDIKDGPTGEGIEKAKKKENKVTSKDASTNKKKKAWVRHPDERQGRPKRKRITLSKKKGGKKWLKGEKGPTGGGRREKTTDSSLPMVRRGEYQGDLRAPRSQREESVASQ